MASKKIVLQQKRQVGGATGRGEARTRIDRCLGCGKGGFRRISQETGRWGTDKEAGEL